MGVQGKAIGGGELLDVGSPAKRRRPQDMRLCETHKVSKKCRRQEIESPCEGTTKGNLVLQVRFDEVRMVAPVAVMEVEAEAEAETAAGAQEVVARVLTRAAYRKEQGGRFKERCFDTQEARRGRTETSDSRRKEQRGELLQKKRLNDGGRKAMAGEPTRRAVAEARMLLPAVEPEEEAAPRACEAPAATCSELGSLLSDVELPGAFPLLELPEELQLLVAAHVFSPRDRAALCVAVPPLGRKAIKQIPAYTGPLMSLGKRVLSGGAASEAEVRQYVREFEPSEAAHPLLALNEYAQLNTMAAPGARVRYVTEGNTLEWRLESGALLRCWKMRKKEKGDSQMGMHHYQGAAGAERLVSLVLADGEELQCIGEKGAPPSFAGYVHGILNGTCMVRAWYVPYHASTHHAPAYAHAHAHAMHMPRFGSGVARMVAAAAAEMSSAGYVHGILNGMCMVRAWYVHGACRCAARARGAHRRGGGGGRRGTAPGRLPLAAHGALLARTAGTGMGTGIPCAWNMACAWRAHGVCMVHAYMHGALLVWQRSAPELHQLLGAAGFVSLTTLPTAGLFSVIVGVKPAAVTAAATQQPPPEVRPTRKRPASPAAEGKGRTVRKPTLAEDPLVGLAPAPRLE